MSGWVIVQGVILWVGNCPTLGADIHVFCGIALLVLHLACFGLIRILFFPENRMTFHANCL